MTFHGHSANTHIPSPFWAAVSPVRIPLRTCNQAADILIEWFGEEDLKFVVGGERWWQVRGLDGIDAEWITEREFLSDAKIPSGTNVRSTDADILRMENLDTVMVCRSFCYLFHTLTRMYLVLHSRRRLLLWIDQYVSQLLVAVKL
jgi:hypothetical protein